MTGQRTGNSSIGLIMPPAFIPLDGSGLLGGGEGVCQGKQGFGVNVNVAGLGDHAGGGSTDELQRLCAEG